jgi:pyruvate dehydrogenase E1 component alpha subunit
MPGVQVDGNDVMAVYAAAREAIHRARAGGGPTLIEAVTYRIGPHTTADDPGRYRPDDEAEGWRRRDPLERVRLYLAERGEWTAGWQEEIDEAAAAEVEAAVEAAEALPPPAIEQVFDGMFAEMPLHLAAQADEAERLAREGE